MFAYMYCKCTACVPGAHGSQRGVSDALELELQMIMWYHVGDGNQT